MRHASTSSSHNSAWHSHPMTHSESSAIPPYLPPNKAPPTPAVEHLGLFGPCGGLHYPVKDEKTLVLPIEINHVKPDTPPEEHATDTIPLYSNITQEKVFDCSMPSTHKRTSIVQGKVILSEPWARRSEEKQQRDTIRLRDPSITKMPSFNLKSRPSQLSKFSKYNRASYSLTNHPNAIELYRDMAEKTNDPQVQINYAKYLLEVAALYETYQDEPDNDNRSKSSTHAEANRRKKKLLEQEGVRWVKKLTKKNLGEAAYIQAVWIEKGEFGFKKNNSKAMQLYRVAAKDKIPEALYAVANVSEKEGRWAEALTGYQGAAKKGLVEAVYRMAKAHLLGELNQNPDIPKALELLFNCSHKATEACPEPPYLIALLLTNDHKIRVPEETILAYGGPGIAVEYFEQAASLGHLESSIKLGKIYEYGYHMAPVDYARCFGYYESAARRNSPEAMLGLSCLANQGNRGPGDNDLHGRLGRDTSGWLATTPPNEDTAFYWCQLAAKKQYPEAMFLLGWYYEAGIGVLRDYDLAQAYYQKAAKKGHEGARIRLLKTNSVTRQQHQEVTRVGRTVGEKERKGRKFGCFFM